MSSWKYAWRYHWKVFKETVSTVNFWYAFFGVLVALLIWFYLLYLSIKYADSSLQLHTRFCSSHEQRNRHIFAIVVLTPSFVVGMIGFIGEWVRFLENRGAGRKTGLRDLGVFALLMMVSTLLIMIALDC